MFRRRMRRRVRRPVRRRPFRRYRRTVKRVPRMLATGVPKSVSIKLRYVETLTGTVNAGSYLTWPFASSLYDPYFPSGGHQPLVYDQWGAMYYRFRVNGIAYRISFQTITANARLSGVTYTNIDQYTCTSVSSALERKNARLVTFGADRDGLLKGYVSVARAMGISPSKYRSEDNYCGSVAANPASMCYLTTAIFSNLASSAEVICHVQLTYYADLFGPTSEGQS